MSLVWRYEKGVYDPKGRIVRDLALALGVTTDWLLGMDEYAPESEADGG
jgi:hypothetical protein